MKIQNRSYDKAGGLARGVLAIAVCTALLMFACSTGNNNNTGDFNLTVNIGPGVVGTPEDGIYPYTAGTVVNYSYSLEPSFTDLVVAVDGEEADPSGSVVMDQTHVISATALGVYDITGTWEMTEEYDDGSSFQVTVTFTGTKEEGTVVDSQGGSGSYRVDSASVVGFNLDFPEVAYEYVGAFGDLDNISGNCVRTTPTDVASGTFTAARTTAVRTIQSGTKGRR